MTLQERFSIDNLNGNYEIGFYLIIEVEVMKTITKPKTITRLPCL